MSAYKNHVGLILWPGEEPEHCNCWDYKSSAERCRHLVEKGGGKVIKENSNDAFIWIAFRMPDDKLAQVLCVNLEFMCGDGHDSEQ